MLSKWLGSTVAAATATTSITANAVVAMVSRKTVPDQLNVLAATMVIVAVVVASAGAIREDIESRFEELRSSVTARLDEINESAGDRNIGFADGYLHAQRGLRSVPARVD